MMDYAITSLQADGSVLLQTGDSTASIQGLQALVQQVIIELLSDYDERSDRGTSMITQINDASFANNDDIKPIVSQAVRTAEAHVLDMQRSMSLTNDERLAAIQFLDADLGSGTYSISIQIFNVSGQSATVAIP